MGKQAQLKQFKRWLRDGMDRGVVSPDAAESYYRQAKGRKPQIGDPSQLDTAEPAKRHISRP